MITTGTKYFIGMSLAAAAGLVVYAIASDTGALGTVGLASAFVALAFLAGIASFIRDGDVSANDTAAVETCGAAQAAPGQSAWPAVVGVGLSICAVGLVTLPAFMILGIVVLLAGLAEWLVQAWAERASADGSFNATVRGRMAYPLELPLAGALVLGIVVFGFSRLVLNVSKEAGPVLFGVAGAIVLLFGFLIASNSRMSKGVVGGIVAVALVAIAGGGIATGLAGERSELATASEEDHFAAEHRECNEEHHEFDENASQSVAATANVAATVRLTDSGLVASQVGLPGENSSITLSQSDVSGIVFINETAEERRLNAEMDSVQIEGTDAFEQRIQCTSLVEEDGSQYMAIVIGLPSSASETPYRLVVPGVEGTEILIEVP